MTVASKNPPRAGTRARALYDYYSTCKQPVRFTDLKAVYDDHPPAYDTREFGPRRYSGMTVSKLATRYGTRISRGLYRFKGYELKPGDRVKVINEGFGDIFKNGEVYTVKVVEPGTTPMVGLLEQTQNLHLNQRFWSHRFELTQDPLSYPPAPAPAPVPVPGPVAPPPPPKDEFLASAPGEAFKKGDLVRYKGGYSHFDMNGVPSGTVLKVAGWKKSSWTDVYYVGFEADTSLRENALKGYPRADAWGHSSEYFEPAPAKMYAEKLSFPLPLYCSIDNNTLIDWKERIVNVEEFIREYAVDKALVELSKLKGDIKKEIK